VIAHAENYVSGGDPTSEPLGIASAVEYVSSIPEAHPRTDTTGDFRIGGPLERQQQNRASAPAEKFIQRRGCFHFPSIVMPVPESGAENGPLEIE
jgi:hypothetical protein